MSRDVIAKIDLSALKYNLARAKTFAPNSRVIAVVKSDAYGHGLLPVMLGLQEADGFAVAHIEEARPLREAGIDKPILILEGPFARDELDEIIALNYQVVVHEWVQIQWIESLLKKKERLTVWLKVNTGMNRLGFSPQMVDEVWSRLNQCAVVTKTILMTHMANADSAVDSRTDKQLYCFNQVIANKSTEVSIANSGLLVHYSNKISFRDWVRPGIMLYGASPDPSQVGSAYGLKPVMTLTAKVIALHDLKMGDEVGYGGHFRAPRSMRIATVGIGYGDGYPRSQQTARAVSIGGQRCAVVGTVSMDMITVDVSALKQVSLGDCVELWGQTIAVEEVAKSAGTISYELFCRLTRRTKREYIPL